MCHLAPLLTLCVTRATMLAEILGIINLAVVMFCLGIVGGWFLRKTLAPTQTPLSTLSTQLSSTQTPLQLPTQFSSVFTYPKGDCIHFINHAKSATDKA